MDPFDLDVVFFHSNIMVVSHTGLESPGMAGAYQTDGRGLVCSQKSFDITFGCGWIQINQFILFLLLLFQSVLEPCVRFKSIETGRFDAM